MKRRENDKVPSNNRRIYYGYIIVTAAFFIMLAIYGINYSFGIFFKPIATDFGWTRAMTAGAFSTSWITAGIFSIFMGALNDKLGPRIVLSLCGILSGSGYILMSQINHLWQLYIFYGVVIGAGISAFIPMVSTIARWFVGRRSMMTGIVAAGIGAGAFVIPPLVNHLILIYQWRTSYMILGIIVIVVVVLLAQLLKRDPAQTGQSNYYEKQTDVEAANDSLSLKDAAGTRQFWMIFIMLFVSGYVLYTVQVHLAPHATDLGISSTSSAAILATMGGTSIAGRAILGSIGDKIGNKRAYMLGFSLVAIALLWLMPATLAWKFFLFAVIFGLAYGNCDTQQSPLVAGLFGLTSHGLVFGVVSIGYAIGSGLGPLIAGYLFDIYKNYQMAFFICIIISVIGIILSAMLTPIRQKSGKLKRI